jgi:nucleoid DNA-binding protein
MADNNASKAKAMTKSAVYNELAQSANVSRKQVAEVFDALAKLIKRELGKKGPGVFAIPGLVKLTLKRYPATKAGKRPNPFKPGEMMDVRAKPARNKVRPRALKGLNEMVK